MKLYPCKYDESMSLEELLVWLLRHIKLKKSRRRPVLPIKLEIRNRFLGVTDDEVHTRWEQAKVIYKNIYGEDFD